jgi:hypothetical protein
VCPAKFHSTDISKYINHPVQSTLYRRHMDSAVNHELKEEKTGIVKSISLAAKWFIRNEYHKTLINGIHSRRFVLFCSLFRNNIFVRSTS